MNMNCRQTVSREEYRRLDNRVTCILQLRWPAKEISQWVGIMQGKLQAVACAAGTLANHPRRADPVSGQSGTIRCAVTGRTLFIAPGSPADHRQHVEAAAKP